MQTMLTVVTQISRLLRRSALSGDRMTFGFGYPHCSVPDARCQVLPRWLMYNIVRVGDLLLSSVWWRCVQEEQKQDRNRSAQRSGPAQRLALFGPPPLIEGEDAAAYDQLLASICAVVKPVDIIDEMFIADVVALEWEVLRWRRLKSSLIRARGLEALEGFLAEQLELNYDLYAEHFADHLAEILRDNFPEDQVEDAQTLAHECARNEPDADDKVNEMLSPASAWTWTTSCTVRGPARQKSSCRSTCGANRTP